MKNKLLTIAVVGLLAGPMTAQAQQYEYEVLGQTGTQVFGINDSGDAVGNTNGSSFVYASMDGIFTDVVPAAGYEQTGGLGINDAGVIVGAVFPSANDVSTRRGMIRSKSGAYTVFDHPDTLSFTEARGVNNKGLVSGLYNDGQLASFIYDPKTASYTNIILPNATRVFAHGINSKGEVVGDARFSANPCDGAYSTRFNYGWLRARDGSVIIFTVNGKPTLARGINDAGMIVGQTGDAVTNEAKGFVIKAPETNCESIAVDASALLDVPGYFNEFPEGISNSGDIVGVVDEGFGVNFRGFIARPL